MSYFLIIILGVITLITILYVIVFSYPRKNAKSLLIKKYRENHKFINVEKIDNKFRTSKKELAYNHHFFTGKKVVITGDLNYFKTRNDLANLLWDNGAIIEENFNSSINILIVGKSNTDLLKLKSAYYLNIKVFTEEEMLSYFTDFKPYLEKLNSEL